MKFLNSFYEQIRENLNAMPMASRIIAGMLITVIMVGIGLLVRTGSESDGTYLFGGRTISDEEMRKAEFAFGQASLRDYEFIGNRIKVPSSASDLYLRALSDNEAIPAEEAAATDKALYTSSIWVSNELLNKRLMVGKEQDIAARIMQFPDVKKASVFYDIQRKGFVSDRQQSASVVVVPHGNEPLSPYTKKRISDLVQGAYAGMGPDDVTVTDTNARGSGRDPWLDENDLHYRTKRSYEQEWEEKIRYALAGYGPPTVVVDVELDPKLGSESTELKIDPNPIALEEDNETRTVESNRGGNGGVPGVASNAYGNAPTRVETASTNKESETRESAAKVVGSTRTMTSTAGLIPVRASVLISLRSSYYDELWKLNWLTENPDKSEADVPPLSPADRARLRTETKEEIQSAVSTIIPRLRAGDDAFPLVKVLDFPDLPEPQIDLPESSGRAISWLASSWQSVAMVLLALVALFIARGSLKAPPSPSPDFAEGFGLEIPRPPVDELAVGEADESASTLPKMEVTGSNLKEELNSIIETNPDAAANVLRSWLSDAA